MVDSKDTQIQYYQQQGILSDPGEYAPLLAQLPQGDLAALRDALQGLMVHIFWAESYGLQLDEERKNEVWLRSVPAKMARILILDSQSLSAARLPERRLVSNCRDFALMFSAAARSQGYPARARCGFGTYFTPGHYEDHWVCEVWLAEQNRWVMLDPQLDSLMRERLQLSFDPLDMPPGAFMAAGEVWAACRRGEINPEACGIFDMHGWGFIRGNVLRDLLALNKIEVLPWDGWGVMMTPLAESPESEWVRIDELAALTIEINDHFDAVREICEIQQELLPPRDFLIK